MALVKKLKEGGTTLVELELYIINNVPAKKYFNVGDDLYDLKKYLDLIWHNLDPFLESKGYGNNIRSQLKIFINLALDQLATGEAKFNSDYSLEMIDKNDMWDNTPGFNTNIFTGDIKNDNRAIPQIGTQYLLTILNSPYMKKKPELSKLSNLTNKVLNRILKSSFNNNVNKFNAEDGFRSYDLKDRVRMFKDALEEFRNYTDFSIYDNSSLKDIDTNMKNALLLLGNTTVYDDTFFDKMSLYGFYGTKKWLGNDTDYDEDGNNGANNANNANSSNGDNNSEGSGTNKRYRILDLDDNVVKSILHDLEQRQYSKLDYDKYVKNIIYSSLNDYYAHAPADYGDSWRNGHRIGFRRVPISNDILQTPSSLYEASMADSKIENEGALYQTGVALTRQLLLYVYGLNTANFNDSMSKEQLLDNIRLVMSRANGGNGLFAKTPLSDKVVYITDSYDGYTKSYLALDVENQALFALPEIFVKTNIWEGITSLINLAMKNSGVRLFNTYSLKDILGLSFKHFLNEVQIRNTGKFFGDLKNYKIQSLKKGGILKALTGALILASKGVNTTDVTQDYQAEVDLLRAQYETERQNLLKLRENKMSAKSAYRDMQSLKEEYDYLKRLDAEIKSWDDLKRNLDTHDKFVIHTLLSDLVALGGSLSGGAFNPVTDAATLSSIIGTVGTVATDKSMNLGEKLFYGTLGVGLNVLGLIPGAGATSNALKVGKVAKEALPILSRVIRYGALGITGLNALGPLEKLAKGQPLTKGDWTSLAYFTEAIIMGNIGRRALRDYRRYTKPVNQKTNYYVDTKSGGRISVTEEVYNKLKGNTIKEVKAKLGKKGKLKDVNGNEITIDNLKTNGVGKIANKGKISGSINQTSAGIRLKTLEELHSEFGIPKFTINGETTYEVPKGYLNIARKLHLQPVVSLEEPAGGPKTTGESVVVKPTDAEPSSKKTFTGKTEETKAKGTEPAAATPEEPVVPGKTPDKTPSKPEKPTRELTLAQQKRKEKLDKIDNDVKLTVKNFIQNRYRGLINTPWESKRLTILFNKVLELKNASGSNFPKNIKHGYTYFVKPNGLVMEAKIDGSRSYMSKLRYYNGNGGYRRFTFKPGGILKYQNPSGALVDPDRTKKEKYYGLLPKNSTIWSKGLDVVKNIVNNPNSYLFLGKLNSDKLAKDILDLHSLELPFTKTMPSANIYVTNPDTYGIKSLADKSKGANNSILGMFGKSGSSKIEVDTGLKYLTSIVDNEAIDDKSNTTINNLLNTYKDKYNTELKAKDTEMRTIADENRQALIAHNNKQLNYLKEYYSDKAKTWSDILGIGYNTAVSKKEALLAFNTKLTEYVLKRYGPYIDSLKKLGELIKDYRTQALENDPNWTGKDDADYLTLTKQYNKLFNESNIYLLKNVFDASQGYLNYDDLMDKVGIYFKKPFIEEDVPNDEDEEKQLSYNGINNNNSLYAKSGGSLSYYDRMSLKKQDAKNKKQEMWYRMIIEDHKQASAEKRQRDKEYNEAKRLINRKSEILLKASLQIK